MLLNYYTFGYRESMLRHIRLLNGYHRPSSTVFSARLVATATSRRSTNRGARLSGRILLLNGLLVVEPIPATVVFDFVESGCNSVKKTETFVSDCNL